jgi:hypothetical protein
MTELEDDISADLEDDCDHEDDDPAEDDGLPACSQAGISSCH